MVHGLNDFWSYNPETREWKEQNITPNPGLRYGSYFWTDPENNFLYLFGGKRDSDTILSDLWRFHTQDQTWESVSIVGDRLSLRDDGVSVKIGNQVYFFEGNEFLRLDLTTLTMSKVISNGIYPEKREDFVMWPHGNKIHLFGGRINSQFFGDFWTFDLSTQTWTLNSEAPPSRWGSGFGYNSGQIFMFGGQTETSSSLSNDLWTFGNTTSVISEKPIYIQGPETLNMLNTIYGITVSTLSFSILLVLLTSSYLIYTCFKKTYDEPLRSVELKETNHDFGSDPSIIPL